ncbi:hypothetical protein CCR75_008498 [Bremia lactucae]|uniref:FYVE-type domain-containing protein n=1 Tax=Bremia lactucae TaxID=4779 RepID=A0A976FMC2_BRELC|nr:hypothetical protein CCR75_008498 [Bremia lactucae]
MLATRRGHTLSRNPLKTFPLPDGYFPEVKLTQIQILDYERQVKTIVKNALVEYERHEAKGPNPTYSAPWIAVGNDGPLTAIRENTPEGLAHSEFRLYGCIPGNYRNFMSFHYAETSQELFEWNQLMYGYAVDAVVLKNIHTRDSGKPHDYLGLKWTCLQSMSFGHKRDTCFLEYLTYTKDKLGRNLGVRVTLPVEIEECPNLYRSLRVRRVATQSISIVRSAEFASDAMQLFIISENDFAGLSMSAKNYKKIMRIYNDMALFVDSKHILKQDWAPNKSRKTCTSCQLSFNVATRHRYHCRLCGDIFCRHCVIIRNVPRDQHDVSKSRIFQVVKSRFCKACLSDVCRESDTAQVAKLALADISYLTDFSDACTLSNLMVDKAAKNVRYESRSRQEWWDDIASESDWSETDSDNASKASLNASGRSRLTSSLSSSQSSWTTSMSENTVGEDDMPFVATLDVIDDNVAILDEKPRSSKSKLRNKLSMSGRYSLSRKHPSRKQFKSLATEETEEVSEVIDTTDMTPASELQQMSRVTFGKRRNDDDLLLCSSGPSSRRSHESINNRFPSSRSITQCLAEQEDLLRCMLSASRLQMEQQKVGTAATVPLQRPTVRIYDVLN